MNQTKYVLSNISPLNEKTILRSHVQLADHFCWIWVQKQRRMLWAELMMSVKLHIRENIVLDYLDGPHTDLQRQVWDTGAQEDWRQHDFLEQLLIFTIDLFGGDCGTSLQ